MKPDLVITEKGVSDLASHFFIKAGVTAIRRIRKTDNLRVARACGATIVSRPDELTEDHVGKGMCLAFLSFSVLEFCFFAHMSIPS